MTSKVLGFRKKDAKTWDILKDEATFFINEQVPVVSVEWLEEQKHLTELTKPWSDIELNSYLQGKLDFFYDLLCAVRKEAGGKSLVQWHYEQLYPRKKEAGKK